MNQVFLTLVRFLLQQNLKLCFLIEWVVGNSVCEVRRQGQLNQRSCYGSGGSVNVSETDGLEPRGARGQGSKERWEKQRRLGRSKCLTAHVQTGHLSMICASFEFLYD